MHPKKKFKTNELNIGNKIKLINNYKLGKFSRKELSLKYKVANGTLSNITANQEKYLNLSKLRNKKSKRFKNDSRAKKVNELVYKFIQQSNATKVPINGSIIQGFTLELAKSMGLNEFKG